MGMRFVGVLGAAGLVSLLGMVSPAQAALETFALNIGDQATPPDSATGTISIDTAEAPFSVSSGDYLFHIQTNIQYLGQLFSGWSQTTAFYIQGSGGNQISILLSNGSVTASLAIPVAGAPASYSAVDLSGGSVNNAQFNTESTAYLTGTLTQQVPEPASLGLLGFALAALACGRQFRGRRVA